MKKTMIAALVLSAFALPAGAQQQQPSQSETIELLRSMVDTYKTLNNEANERIASIKAELVLTANKHKALQAELDKLKAEKAKTDEPAKSPSPK